jgi:hypothetical protein
VVLHGGLPVTERVEGYSQQSKVLQFGRHSSPLELVAFPHD